MTKPSESTIDRPDEEWRKELPSETFAVMRKHGTERAGTSPLNNEHRPGMYACAACGLPLFESSTKFDSGSGWPSFFAPLPKAVGHHHRSQPRHGAHRSALRALRRTFGSRISGRPAPHRRALLHERRGAEIRAEVVETAILSQRLSCLGGNAPGSGRRPGWAAPDGCAGIQI